MRRRADASWHSSWRIADDVGSDYLSVGAGGGGSGGALWTEFRVEFHPGVPPAAQQLIIESPSGDEIAVGLK